MSNLCVSCGAEIPEGRQTCPECATKYDELNIDVEESFKVLRKKSNDRISKIVKTARMVYDAALQEGFSQNQSLQIVIGLINNQCKTVNA